MKRSKYGNIKTTVGGIVFASAREAKRYAELKLLERAGRIERLELQPKFPCIVNGVKVCDYIADFGYWNHVTTDTVERVIEDSKGFLTPVYRLKRKLVHALYPGIKIIEV
jgi:hypothetical protein